METPMHILLVRGIGVGMVSYGQWLPYVVCHHVPTAGLTTYLPLPSPHTCCYPHHTPAAANATPAAAHATHLLLLTPHTVRYNSRFKFGFR